MIKADDFEKLVCVVHKKYVYHTLRGVLKEKRGYGFKGSNGELF
jgi:hypothetical protein